MAVAVFGDETYRKNRQHAGELTAYIQNWLAALKDDKSMLLKASRKAIAAVGYIL